MMMSHLVTLDVLLDDWLDENPNRWDMPLREAKRIIHKTVEDAVEGAKDEG